MGRQIFNFEKLEIWQEGMSLAKVVYSVTRRFPAAERYGLTAQMRRCAISIPSNIAEGSGRRTDKDFLRFAYLARGSLLELVTQIKLANSLQFLDDEKTARMLERAEKLFAMLSNFIKYLSKSG